jgi:hypothetical protein
MAAKSLFYLVALVKPEESVVHEDASQPVAHGAMDQDCGYGAVDSAGEPTDNPLVRPHELLDASDLGFDEMTRGPIRRAPADLEQKVVEDLPASRRMGHLRMELHSEDWAPVVLERGDR